MSKRTLIAFLIIFMLSLSLGFTAGAYVLAPSHLAKNSTFWYSIGNSISDAGCYSIVVADNQWNGISGRKVYLAKSSTRNDQTTRTKNGTNEIFHQNLGGTGDLALTRCWATNGITIEADTALNTYYPLSNSVPPISTSYCVKSLMVHEMGHWIGLDESNYDSMSQSVMSPTQKPGVSDYTLKVDDINGYYAIDW